MTAAATELTLSPELVVLTLDEPEFDDRVLAAFLRKGAVMLDPAQRRAIP